MVRFGFSVPLRGAVVAAAVAVATAMLAAAPVQPAKSTSGKVPTAARSTETAPSKENHTDEQGHECIISTDPELIRLTYMDDLVLAGDMGQANTTSGTAILPERFTLTGPAARQPLLVESRRDGDYVGQLTDHMVWTSSNPKVVKIEDGVALPVGDGMATLTAKAGDYAATADVTVVQFDRPAEISFRNQVQSVLAKSGCNSGACHGAAAGKNGFKLSLRGYDADADFFTITRQDRGRRIVPSDPARSLMLLKPTGVLPHKGGVRFEVGSVDYNTLVQWIAAGAPAPSADDPRLERLEILPERVMLKPGEGQRLLVRAHYSDGHCDDVTHWAKFTSSDESVAQVDQQGNVKIMGSGEGIISAWFASRIKVATITGPRLHGRCRSADQSCPAAELHR